MLRHHTMVQRPHLGTAEEDAAHGGAVGDSGGEGGAGAREASEVAREQAGRAHEQLRQLARAQLQLAHELEDLVLHARTRCCANTPRWRWGTPNELSAATSKRCDKMEDGPARTSQCKHCG